MSRGRLIRRGPLLEGKYGVGGFSDPPHWILVLSDSKTIPIPNPGRNSNPVWGGH